MFDADLAVPFYIQACFVMDLDVVSTPFLLCDLPLAVFEDMMLNG